MIACRLTRRGAAVLTLVFLVSSARAQYGSTTTSETQPNNYPPVLPPRHGPIPALVFERLGEIALPGPLGTAPAFLDDGLVVLPVDGGWARVAPDVDATPTIVPTIDPPPSSDWVVAPGGKRRFRTTQEGLVEAQRRSRIRDAWVSSWSIVAPNSIMAPPILLGPRLCYAGLDDRVTCVRASNGHRLWAADLGDRLSRDLACWPDCTSHEVNGDILLVVPDDGASVVALDAYDGRRVTTFDLPATQRFASSALVAARDRIAIARKGYDDKEAALVLLRLASPPPRKTAPGPVPYNDDSPARTGPSGR